MSASRGRLRAGKPSQRSTNPACVRDRLKGVDQTLSSAVLVYLSVGRKPWPSRDAEGVETAFGDAALDLVPRIKAIEEEVYAKDPEWAAVSFDEAVSGVEAMLRETHPELTDQALMALVNAFAFDWRELTTCCGRRPDWSRLARLESSS